MCVSEPTSRNFMSCLTRPYVDGGVSRLKGLFGVGKSIETAITVLTIFFAGEQSLRI